MSAPNRDPGDLTRQNLPSTTNNIQTTNENNVIADAADSGCPQSATIAELMNIDPQVINNVSNSNFCDTKIYNKIYKDRKDYNTEPDECKPPESVICAINDAHCTSGSYVINGFCKFHALVFFQTWIMENTACSKYPIPVPLCSFDNKGVVNIFPLISFHRDLTIDDLSYIYLDHKIALNDMKVLIAAFTRTYDPNAMQQTDYSFGTPNTMRTHDVFKKAIQFSEEHRKVLATCQHYLSRYFVYLYFTPNYKPVNARVQEFVKNSRLIEGSVGTRVLRVSLLEIGNMLDIYNLMRFVPSRVTQPNAPRQVMDIPNVIVLDGVISYGTGFGMIGLIDPNKPKYYPNTYCIKSTEFAQETNQTQTYRIPSMVMDGESTAGDAPILLVFNQASGHSLSTKVNIQNNKPICYQLPSITNQRAICYN